MSSTFWLIAFSQDCYYLNIQYTNLILGKLSIFTGLGIALKNLSLCPNLVIGVIYLKAGPFYKLDS